MDAKRREFREKITLLNKNRSGNIRVHSRPFAVGLFFDFQESPPICPGHQPIRFDSAGARTLLPDFIDEPTN
jgi:hypothetical protein